MGPPPPKRRKAFGPSAHSRLTKEPFESSYNVGAISPFPHSISWSADNTVAFVTDSGVSVADLEWAYACRVSNGVGGRSRPTCTLPLLTPPQSTPESYQKVRARSDPNRLRSLLDSKVVPAKKFRSVFWSPIVPHLGGCLLAAVDTAYGVSIFRRTCEKLSNKWNSYIDVLSALRCARTPLIVSAAWCDGGLDAGKSALLLALGSQNGRIYLIRINTQAAQPQAHLIMSFAACPPGTAVCALTWGPAPDGRVVLASGSARGDLVLFQTSLSGRENHINVETICELRANSTPMSALERTILTGPDGSLRVAFAAACGEDLVLCALPCLNTDEPHKESSHCDTSLTPTIVQLSGNGANRVSGIAWCHGLRWIMATSENGCCGAWDVQAIGSNGRVSATSVHSDALQLAMDLASTEMDSFLKNRKVQAGNISESKARVPMRGIAVSPDCALIALTLEGPVNIEASGTADRPFPLGRNFLFPQSRTPSSLFKTIQAAIATRQRVTSFENMRISAFNLERCLESEAERYSRMDIDLEPEAKNSESKSGDQVPLIEGLISAADAVRRQFERQNARLLEPYRKVKSAISSTDSAQNRNEQTRERSLWDTVSGDLERELAQWTATSWNLVLSRVGFVKCLKGKTRAEIPRAEIGDAKTQIPKHIEAYIQVAFSHMAAVHALRRLGQFLAVDSMNKAVAISEALVLAQLICRQAADWGAGVSTNGQFEGAAMASGENLSSCSVLPKAPLFAADGNVKFLDLALISRATRAMNQVAATLTGSRSSSDSARINTESVKQSAKCATDLLKLIRNGQSDSSAYAPIRAKLSRLKPAWKETCPVCDVHMASPMSRFRERCANGHVSERCIVTSSLEQALTRKRCGLCGGSCIMGLATDTCPICCTRLVCSR